jgi:primosomal protein N'
MQLPRVITVDMREELKNGNRCMFSARLVEEMKKAMRSSEL